LVHEAAAQGFQRHAAIYQRARPTYHPALVQWCAQRWVDRRVIELGAGTGILSAQLRAAGILVRAVEPVEAMRRTFRETLGMEAVDGTAESIPFADASADVVTTAQAFHWFDAPAALDEIARVLRPDGELATVWNVTDKRVPWVGRYSEVVERYAGDTPRHATMDWRRAIERDGRFAFIDERAVANPTPTDAQGVVDRALSTSFVAVQDESTQQRIADEIRRIVADLGPRFDFPYRSEVQCWHLH
jgi:SAM-dependent methyltransferase